MPEEFAGNSAYQDGNYIYVAEVFKEWQDNKLEEAIKEKKKNTGVWKTVQS